MGTTVGYWLPSDFLDDSVMEKNDTDPDFCFPTEFPYDIEILSGERFKEKGRVMSTSPQSTLAHTRSFSSRSNGIPNGLELNDVVTPNLYPSVFHNIRLQEQKQGSGMQYRGPQQWPVQRNPARIGRSGPRAILLGGSGVGSAVKRECAGTGVFLPRRYDDKNAYSSGYHPSAPFIPQRNGFAPSQPPRFNRGFVPEHDLVMARRHALLSQYKRSLLLEGPSRVREWTY